MEYLIEVRWNDPLAEAIGRLLRVVPQGAEQTTGDVPRGPERSDSSEVLEALARAVSKLGAQVRVTPVSKEAG